MLTLRNKDKMSPIEMEGQIKNLKEQNTRLKDSLLLQSTELENERRENQQKVVEAQIFLGKYHRLQKEKQEVVKKYEELLLIMMRNNINIDNRFIQKNTEVSTNNKNIDKNSKQIDSKATTCRSSRASQVECSTMLLNKILKNITQTKSKQQSQISNKKYISNSKFPKDKSLSTFKQVNGSHTKLRLSVEKNQKPPQLRRRLSYFQKIKGSLTL